MFKTAKSLFTSILPQAIMIGIVGGVGIGLVIHFFFPDNEMARNPYVMAGLSGLLIGGIVPVIFRKKFKELKVNQNDDPETG